MIEEKEIRWLLDIKYQGELTKAAEKDIQRLKKGEHVDRIIGYSDFLGLKIYLSEKPLIPRTETEYWIEQLIGHLLKDRISKAKRLNVLDLFCGSGCIGLAILKNIPGSRVDFSDIERRYFKDIKKSARINKISLNGSRFLYSNVLKNIGIKKYDLILANPPYIPSSRKLPASVRKNDPKKALFGGKDGLRFIRPLLKEGKKYLKADGKLWLEFDSGQKNRIAALSRQYGWSSNFSRDQYGRWRYVSLEVLRPVLARDPWL